VTLSQGPVMSVCQGALEGRQGCLGRPFFLGKSVLSAHSSFVEGGFVDELVH
jgi:hypothetical protein